MPEIDPAHHRGALHEQLTHGTDWILASTHYDQLHLTSRRVEDVGTGRVRPLKFFDVTLGSGAVSVSNHGVYYRTISAKYLVLSHTVYQQVLMKMPFAILLSSERELHAPSAGGFLGQLFLVGYSMPTLMYPRCTDVTACFVHSAVPLTADAATPTELSQSIWQTFIAMYGTNTKKAQA